MSQPRAVRSRPIMNMATPAITKAPAIQGRSDTMPSAMGSSPSCNWFWPVTVKNNARRNSTPIIQSAKRDRKPRNMSPFSRPSGSPGSGVGSGARSGFIRVRTMM